MDTVKIDDSKANINGYQVVNGPNMIIHLYCTSSSNIFTINLLRKNFIENNQNTSLHSPSYLESLSHIHATVIHGFHIPIHTVQLLKKKIVWWTYNHKKNKSNSHNTHTTMITIIIIVVIKVHIITTFLQNTWSTLALQINPGLNVRDWWLLTYCYAGFISEIIKSIPTFAIISPHWGHICCCSPYTWDTILNDLCILHEQYHCCWWPDNTMYY